MPGVRVSLVCKCPLFLAGMARSIASREDYSIVSRLRLTLDALNPTMLAPADVWVIDPADAAATFAMIAEIRQLPGHPKVMVFSERDDADYVDRVLAAGATGYLTHDSTGAELLACLQAVLDGDIFITPWVSRSSSSDHPDLAVAAP